MKFVECLTNAIRKSAVYNPEIQVAPACILWPDRDRQWEAVIPLLRVELPELLTLGDFDPDQGIGPAIWLRCVISDCAESPSKEFAPIVYLPGVSRQDLRAVESCPEHLKPLAELQYRGVIWSQINAKDWTILAFLKSDQGGLGLDVAQDTDTKTAMQLALYRLLDEDVELLKGKPLTKDYFNTLLTGGDLVKDLLKWLDEELSFKNGRDENEWKAFVEVCKSQLAFNPQLEGVLAGAEKLANHTGPWLGVWDRFCEAPHRYPSIPLQIRKCQMPLPDIFADESTFGGWPQWNETEENTLRSNLKSLNNAIPQTVRTQLRQIEQHHGQRRQLVWAELGEAPLALALGHLLVLAELTQNALAAGTIDEISTQYQTVGWQVDDAVLKALDFIDKPIDFEAVSAVIRAIYLPWLDESARYLQKQVDALGYPGGNINVTNDMTYPEGQCVIFVDGLRYDTAKRLVGMLANRGLDVNEKAIWTALPSVTATGKAAVSPVKNKIIGEDCNSDFEPCVATTGQSLKGGYHLKKLLLDSGWRILERSDNGDGQGNAWCEFGDIDHEGHDRGWKLAKHLDNLLKEINERIHGLLVAGWKSVRVVTDHGWLLLPGGLPKIDLNSNLTDSKWGRCAGLKPGAATEQSLYAWYWNPHHHFVLANGVSCFKSGEEYTHGGLSCQECLTLELTVSQREGASQFVSVEVTDIAWKGLRCTVAVDGSFSGLSLDIRLQPGDALSSVVVGIKSLKDNGTASVVVENEELEGKKAALVLVDTNGLLVVQLDTVIGGD
ncbi:MAG: BREX-1 system phosphatase PglZ type B [Methylicorpusculum sp.]|uniref:BREX-1 system phosphatase PglZ type B n=1 Tax=Methylicorpusculum sp. TaxID=2713644 RepID=UPI002730695A|nr:BREX-1 system phosphatase PglZ type B [Methylicorpusculum sp.]MDP2203749.1 BREX-1 system phosphatase PglZ type B [Methylicorpusculum sp.]